MSILEELREQAQQASNKPAVEEKPSVDEPPKSAREAYVERRLLPIMKALHDYFSEFHAHVTAINPQIEIDYELDGIGSLAGLKATDYTFEADNADTVRQFTFCYACRGERTSEFKLKGTQGDQQKAYLTANKLRFRSKPARNMTVLTVEPAVPVRYEFALDIEREAISLNVINAGALGVLRHTLAGDTVTPKLLDELAKHMLCKPNRFNELTGNVLSDTGRFRIQNLVEQERQERETGNDSLAGRFKRKLFGNRDT